MKRDKYIPELRFDGFEEEWEQSVFTNVTQKRKLINSNMYERNLLSLSYGKIKRKDINGTKGLLPSSFSSYQIIDDGTIVFRFTDLQNDKKSLRVGLSKEKGIVSSAYVCVDSNRDKLNPEFLYWLLHHKDTNKVFYKMGDGIRQTISFEDLKELIIYYPRKKEQDVVAKILNTIDTSIINQEKYCDLLYNLKSALIVRLFPQGKETQPRLRLDGFSGEWEKHLFSEYAYCIKRKNINISSQNILTISALHGLISQSEFYNKRIASSDLSGYYLMYQGEFAYNKSYSADYPWGAVKRLDKYTDGVVSNLYITFGLNNIDSDFVVCYFMSDLWHKEVSLCAKEGARNHGLLNISADDFFDISILIPKTIKEQKAIAKIIFEFDKLIQLNELKLEKLKNLKQSMLDKMFV